MDSKELKQRFCRPKTLASSGLTRYGCCNPPQWSQNLNDKKQDAHLMFNMNVNEIL